MNRALQIRQFFVCSDPTPHSVLLLLLATHVVIGVGVLGLPYAARLMGWYYALLAIIVASLISIYSALIIGWCIHRRTADQTRRKNCGALLLLGAFSVMCIACASVPNGLMPPKTPLGWLKGSFSSLRSYADVASHATFGYGR